ncbi:hypothetical protein ACUBKK_02910 [Klebsiella quasipneumoniae subsp. similipneumoniae]|uniref:hypothetical protein n=1 Tax=Klebsiella quasipneumoniae TaxID=1463165 RepID=UPI00403ACFE5
METETNGAFDIWYKEVCTMLAQDGKCAPYKMAWMEFYERGLTPTQAAEDEFAPTEDIG